MQTDDSRERWFQIKLEELSYEINQLTNESHTEFLAQCVHLEEDQQRKLKLAECYRDLQINNILAKFEATKKHLSDDFFQERQHIKERMLNALIDRQKQLEEERLDSGATSIYEAPAQRKLRRRNASRHMEDAQATQPLTLLNYKKRLPSILHLQLREEEISEDLSAIRGSSGMGRSSMGLREKRGTVYR